MRWISEVRERLRGLFLRSREDAEMDEEMRFHLEMEAERLVRERGLRPAEARRQAAIAFGGVQRYREEVRDARGLAWVPGCWLDFKLGLRMLVKHPGLTLVGGLGMAVAIAIGAFSFALFYSYALPSLPLDEGERVVGIENWDAAASEPRRQVLHDFAAWRAEVRTLEDLGAFRDIERNLVVPGGRAELFSVAEMTASGFRLARVPPLLGRYLVEEDERQGGPPLVVIGHDVWRSHFAGDPAVVGREVRLGDAVHTVVGVMPEGFAFPVNHRLWTPLRADPADYERGQGPAITVFGRLAPGATLDDARAELAAIGARAAAAFPASHERLRPRVLPYTSLFMGGLVRWQLHLVQLLVSLLLVVVGANVAILVYARTAMRRGEIAVRSALGASRRRIVVQLFLEALVLSAGAAALGLGLARLAFARVDAALAREAAHIGGLPFWIDFGLSRGAVLYALGLAVLAAVIVGVVPAMKATGRRLQASLRQLGGGTGMQLGRTWTVLIVAQVALAVAVLPGAVFSAWSSFRQGAVAPGFAAEEFLTARIEMDRETPPSAQAAAYERAFAARYADRLGELVRRLEAEPGVSAVTFSAEPAGQEPEARIEIEGVSPVVGSAAGQPVRVGRVGVGYFSALDVPLLAGRSFQEADLHADPAPVVVSRRFVQQYLGGGGALGRRVRYAGGGEAVSDSEPARWYEIVGVVGDFPGAAEPDSEGARLYHPLAEGTYPVSLAVRMRGADATAFAGRFHQIATSLDPALQPREIRTLDDFLRQEQVWTRLGALALGLVTLCVLLLSAAGIYALMSFTVARRTREIGVRAALGAGPGRILASVFSRALGQLLAGVAVGVLVAAQLDRLSDGALMGGREGVLLPAVAALMVGVGLLAALGPARQGLRIQPMEALRSDA